MEPYRGSQIRQKRICGARKARGPKDRAQGCASQILSPEKQPFSLDPVGPTHRIKSRDDRPYLKFEAFLFALVGRDDGTVSEVHHFARSKMAARA